MMIQETLIDIGPFMILVILTVCAFANAIYVLDEYETVYSKQLNIEYEPIVQQSYDFLTTDAFVN